MISQSYPLSCIASFRPGARNIISFTSFTSLSSSPAPMTNDHLKHPAVIDVTRTYAIVARSLFAVLTTVNFCIHLCTILQTYTVWILRHIVYSFFLERHHLVWQWSLKGFICFGPEYESGSTRRVVFVSQYPLLLSRRTRLSAHALIPTQRALKSLSSPDYCKQ